MPVWIGTRQCPLCLSTTLVGAFRPQRNIPLLLWIMSRDRKVMIDDEKGNAYSAKISENILGMPGSMGTFGERLVRFHSWWSINLGGLESTKSEND